MRAKVPAWFSVAFEKPQFKAVSAYYDRLAERPGYKAHLVDEWLPALEGVEEKLRAGGKVAEQQLVFAPGPRQSIDEVATTDEQRAEAVAGAAAGAAAIYGLLDGVARVRNIDCN